MSLKKFTVTVILLLLAGSQGWADEKATPKFLCLMDQYEVSVWDVVGDKAAITVLDTDQGTTAGYVTDANVGLSGTAPYWVLRGHSAQGDILLALAASSERENLYKGHFVATLPSGKELKDLLIKCERLF